MMETIRIMMETIHSKMETILNIMETIQIIELNDTKPAIIAAEPDTSSMCLCQHCGQGFECIIALDG